MGEPDEELEDEDEPDEPPEEELDDELPKPEDELLDEDGKLSTTPQKPFTQTRPLGQPLTTCP